MKLRVNISTCPNDTFMFDAMLDHRIDTEGLEFDVSLSDIEELNHEALQGAADLTKVSYAVVPRLRDHYKVLHSGSALGRGNGPLLVSRGRICPDQMSDITVAIPGIHTTANRLLTLLYPAVHHRQEYIFSDIMDCVISGTCDAGVLIHEGRFTYQNKGLCLIADLGIEWEKQTGLPLPLGAIVVSRRLDTQTQRRIDRVLRRSVEYALAHPCASADFVKKYAQELSDEITRKHIELFVNDYSVDLGRQGVQAVCRLLELEDEKIFV